MGELMIPHVGSTPRLCYIWGRVRPVVNAFAVAWARELSPDPFWIEVGPPEPNAAAVGQFAPDRLLVVRDPARLAPADEMSSAALWSLVRPEEDRDDVGRLTEFLRIPGPVREAVSTGPADGASRAIVIANCDRLRPFYPGFASRNRDLIESLRYARVSLVFTVTGEPAPDRRNGPFDAVVEVEAESLLAWRRGKAKPERVPPGSRLRAGQPLGLTSLPEVARVLTGLSADA